MTKILYTFALESQTIELQPGDHILDFRGDTHTFKSVQRMPEPGRAGKVETDKGVFYHHVFPGLNLIEE